MKQKEAEDLLKMGHNIYLTGSAGSGKTFLLNKYIQYLQSKNISVGITASTGIAATHLGGMTIHSWSGLGVRDNLSANDLRDLPKKRPLAKRLLAAQVLIIDEISMLSADQLDMVDKICRRLKKNPAPFGGLQVILSGDFFQLPPVSREGEESRFAVLAEIWRGLDLKICYLSEQHRQQDSRLIKILNDIRTDQVGEETLALLKSRTKKITAGPSGLTKLYTHNADVDAINNQRLQAISGKTRLYQMRSHGREPLVEALKRGCQAPESLYLKTGALVMFVKNNFEQGYVNGTLGKVVDFNEEGFPVVEVADSRKIVANPVTWVIAEEGETLGEICQVPLRLAWAITVHKSQGMSLEAAEIDLSRSFEPGMGYVALSRVRSLDGISLIGLNDMALIVNQEILQLDNDFKVLSDLAVSELEKLSRQEIARRHKNFLEFAGIKREEKPRKKRTVGGTYQITKELVAKKMPIKDLAKERALTENTIVSHLEKLIKQGEKLDLEYLKPPAERFEKIKAAFLQSGEWSLSPVKEILGDSFTYAELRLARLFLMK